MRANACPAHFSGEVDSSPHPNLLPQAGEGAASQVRVLRRGPKPTHQSVPPQASTIPA
jgi:hypothetical protein